MRKVKVLANSVYYHQLWLFLTVVVFVIIGGYLLIRNIYKKSILINRVQETTKQLNTKADKLEDTSYVLQDVEKYVAILEEELSPDFLLADYMVDLAVVCGQTGYSLDRFYPSSGEGNGNYRIGILLSGTREPEKIVEAIESMKRITSIDSMTINFGNAQNTINMSINVLSGNSL